MHHLDRGTEDGSAEVGSGVHESSLEAVGPRGEVSVLWNDRHFVLVVGNDLSEFGLDEFRAGRLVTKALENASGVVETTLHDEETGRFWKPK